MSINFAYYIFALLAIIVGFLIVKKITSCLLKSIIMLVIIAILIFLYTHYLH